MVPSVPWSSAGVCLVVYHIGGDGEEAQFLKEAAQVIHFDDKRNDILGVQEDDKFSHRRSRQSWYN